MQIAQLTYPVLLARYEAILVTYSQHIQRNTEGKDRLQLDETLCVLEVCSAMKIAPAVADAAPQTSSQQQVPAKISLTATTHTTALLGISFLSPARLHCTMPLSGATTLHSCHIVFAALRLHVADIIPLL